MDTSSTAAKRSIRANLSEQYEARVAATTEKLDPNRAKANEALKEDNLEVEALTGTLEGYKEALPKESDNYLDAPLLTLRELMPGATGGDAEDRDLDQSFRSNKIEFMVVQRPLNATEKAAGTDRTKSSMKTSWGAH